MICPQCESKMKCIDSRTNEIDNICYREYECTECHWLCHSVEKLEEGLVNSIASMLYNLKLASQRKRKDVKAPYGSKKDQ